MNPTTDTEHLLIPFPRTAILGCEVRSISTHIIGTPLQPRYLSIPRSIAQDFEILEIKIDLQSQLRAEGEVPAEAFADDGFVLHDTKDFPKPSEDIPITSEDTPVPSPQPSSNLIALKMDAGHQITIVVRNLNPYPRNFSAVMYGVPASSSSSADVELATLIRGT